MSCFFFLICCCLLQKKDFTPVCYCVFACIYQSTTLKLTETYISVVVTHSLNRSLTRHNHQGSQTLATNFLDDRFSSIMMDACCYLFSCCCSCCDPSSSSFFFFFCSLSVFLWKWVAMDGWPSWLLVFIICSFCSCCLLAGGADIWYGDDELNDCLLALLACFALPSVCKIGRSFIFHLLLAT